MLLRVSRNRKLIITTLLPTDNCFLFCFSVICWSCRYHLRMQLIMHLVMSVCVSVCLVCTLIFESLDLETSLLVCRYSFGISRSNLFIKAIGSRSVSLEQKRSYEHYKLNTHTCGWSGFDWQATLFLIIWYCHISKQMTTDFALI